MDDRQVGPFAEKRADGIRKSKDVHRQQFRR
jgi:hypothetical protein